MGIIHELDESTINRIAAGEVIERPASVVKELAENAIDAGATAVAIEIREGGIAYLRVTDNGSGIAKEDIRMAFVRHATSKIKDAADLPGVVSLGFRGEALSSIAAVAQVEVLSKRRQDIEGVRYVIEGGEERSFEEVGTPDGTTFIVRNLFYHTPVRRKFLKTPAGEASQVAEIVERIALSHPEVSVRYIVNGQNKIHTPGNRSLKDCIYQVYGKDIARNLIQIDAAAGDMSIAGFMGKPIIARGNRSYEIYFVNGRYIKSPLIAKAVEDAYQPYLMQHKYPLVVLQLTIAPEQIDVNVHPAKMEVRFKERDQVYRAIFGALSEALKERPAVTEATLPEPKPAPEKPAPAEPAALSDPVAAQEKPVPAEPAVLPDPVPAPEKSAPAEPAARPIRPAEMFETVRLKEEGTAYGSHRAASPGSGATADGKAEEEELTSESGRALQMSLFDEDDTAAQAKKDYRIVGQVFETYWIVEFKDQIYFIDQHAAHEKILYERTMKSFESRQYTVQQISPPMVIHLSMREEQLLSRYMDYFTRIGFEIEHFGERDYAVRGVPDNLLSISKRDLLIDLIDSLDDLDQVHDSKLIQERVASMSCKAAVKGNHRMSLAEATRLIDELLTLEQPFHCPHGRPTIITMSKYEMEKKFKRIL